MGLIQYFKDRRQRKRQKEQAPAETRPKGSASDVKDSLVDVLMDDNYVMQSAQQENYESALQLVAGIEVAHPYLKGVSELLKAHPSTFCMGTHRTMETYEKIVQASPHLASQLERMAQLRDENQALVVTGIRRPRFKGKISEGYSPDTFERQFVLHSGVLSEPKFNVGDMYCALKDIGGTFEYNNRILVVTDDKQNALKFFRFEWGRMDEEYSAQPSQFVGPLFDLPTEEEFQAMDELVRSYERGLIRLGCIPSHLQEGGMSLLSIGISRTLDKMSGSVSKRRPNMTFKQGRQDTETIKNEHLRDIRMHDIEDAVEVVYTTNKLVAFLEKHHLLQ